MARISANARSRPLNVYVARGSEAEGAYRRHGGVPGAEPIVPSALVPGVRPSRSHDLLFHGGKTIRDLAFANFYVGGDAAWNASDRASIDQALAAAMSDPNLNHVMEQYFKDQPITSTFKGSQVLPGTPPTVVSQGDVENLVASLQAQGTLNAYDLSSTVFNFMLPRGTVLNDDAAPTGEVGHAAEAHHPRTVPVEDAVDSLHGLGGYHGSIHAGAAGAQQTIYYAVGVYSEQTGDTTNGIPVFDQPWKNVVATFYHELNEARTDSDVEDAIRAGNDPSATKFLGWTSRQGEECGDFPVFEANPLTVVFQEVELTDKSGTVPVQFQYSDFVHGPEGPIPAADPAPKSK
jgi:hypothetical protein